MKEIKCPHCGKIFSVAESDYESIVSQIKTKEFEDELKERIETLHQSLEKDSKLKEQQIENKKNEEISKLKGEILSLTNKISSSDKDKALAVNEAEQNKEKEIARLKEELNQANNRLNEKDLNTKLEISKVEAKFKDELAKKVDEINKLNSDIRIKDTENELKIKNIKSESEQMLKIKQEELEHYKDLKSKLSTKLVGETLEQHCQNEFNRIRMTAFPKAYFEKDNKVSGSGSKGDFIYRETDENGVEIISIMFEMKNENETTATKHKNEDFFAELDKDRREKKCEYAVLVSLLEAESEFYNAGIVDVSYRFNKMYVVRPQCFIPIITLLRNAAMNSLEIKQELAIAKNQSIDITNFENKLLDFQDKFGKNFLNAKTNFEKAIKQIDDSIADLQKVKASLLISENQLRLANDKAQEITIKKLTWGNPTMKKMFDEVNSEDSNDENNY